jgi:prepilin-type N-terminal cleavage/methylation domain-containing protein
MRLLHTYHFRDGFTLVELLVTLAVFTFVIGIIYATYSMGIFMWKTTETKLWTVQEARMSLERIIREARGARQGSVTILPTSTTEGFKFTNIDNKETTSTTKGFKFTNIDNKEITFELSGDKILRKVNNTGSNIVATNVNKFLIEPVGISYRITIVFNNDYTVSGIFTPRNK